MALGGFTERNDVGGGSAGHELLVGVAQRAADQACLL